MAGISEVSYGSRLSNAHRLVDALSICVNYAPPRALESIVAYKALLAATEMSNAGVAIHTDTYNSAVKARELAFRKSDTSVMKILSPINQAVIAQFGKDSREWNSINTIISRIRNSKVVVYVDKNGDERTISQSEQSYGSLTQLFKDLVNILSNFTAYNPSRNELKVATLTAFAGTLESINQTANLAQLQITASRNSRNAQYEDLHERTGRIKAYVSSEYGLHSAENKAIKGLKI
jgi:hypothetical protein